MGSLRVRIFHGTRSPDAPRLCDTCESGVVLRGASESDEHVFCNLLERRISTRVVECNRYVDRSAPSLWDMRQIAWILHSDANRRPIGFLTAKDWREETDEDDPLPGVDD
ncbi:MAG TPA: hypothetical protein VE621_17905 [Bryobacteraceae bacterium]|nr:hypothetical protein [Bryobacteraceae bacterium]